LLCQSTKWKKIILQGVIYIIEIEIHPIDEAYRTNLDLTDEDRERLNGGVERVIPKGDRDEMLRQLSREISKCVKLRTTRVA
jgi:hypothetical protein